MADILSLRADIDAIDARLVELFIKRMRVCEDIARVKAQNALPVYDPARECEKLTSVCERAPEKYRESVRALYKLMFDLSRARQRDIIAAQSGK